MLLHTFTLLLSFLLAVSSFPQSPPSYGSKHGSNSATTIPSINDYTDGEIASGSALAKVAKLSNRNLQASGACSMQSASPRPEWRTMPKSTRKSYVDAVTCMMKTPTTISASDRAEWPGVFSRYDEYVATHINLTQRVHFTADFLAWHRYFTYLYEKDLQKCGYKGPFPYWDWALDAGAPRDSPLFDGSDHSMGSDGDFVPNRGTLTLGLANVSFPAGTGGGCYSKGPFNRNEYNATMGPINGIGRPNVGKHDYNPHCMLRDLNPYNAQRWTSYKAVTDDILKYDTIDWFQGVMQADPRYKPTTNQSLGLHGGGHLVVGGEMADFYSAVIDPVFFLHHAQIDRIWTVWQNLDPANRTYAIWGTRTSQNDPPSANGTLDDIMEFGFIGEPIRVRDAMDTLAGTPLCYYYV